MLWIGGRSLEDSNGSPEYKRNLLRLLVRRCFVEALSRVEPH